MEKKNNVLKGILIIFGLVIVGLGVFFIYDKVINHEVMTKEEDLSLVAESLMKIIDENHLSMMDYTAFKMTNEPSQESLYGMFSYYREQVEDWANNYNKFKVSKKQVDDYFLRVYNITPSSYPTYICLIDKEPLYVYDKEKESYVVSNNEHGHGASHDYTVASVYTSISKDNNLYTIKTLRLIGEEGDYVIGHEKSYLELSKYEGYPPEEDAIKFFKEHQKEFTNYKPQYEYVFEKINDNYYLKEFKPINLT